MDMASDLLSPSQRSLYTSALSPPVGYVFDSAVVTSFSAQLEFLLEAPVHLAMMNTDSKTIANDPIRLMDAVRRYSDKLCVFFQQGRLIPPANPNVLFGLLEPFCYEVSVEENRVFHPKIWLIRFKAGSGDKNAYKMRLVILSRNLTHDQSWDIIVKLDGSLAEEVQPVNIPIQRFLDSLPSLAMQAGRSVQPDRLEIIEQIKGDLGNTRWQLPQGYYDLKFYFHGINENHWEPPKSSRMLVISPFLTDSSLKRLGATCKGQKFLVSNSHTLDELSIDTLSQFDTVRCFNPDIEDALTSANEEWSDTNGLHAKVYVFEYGANTIFVTGSANATNAALGKLGRGEMPTNVEVLMEVKASKRVLGSIDDVLSSDSLGEFLLDFEPNENHEVDEAQKEIESLLEDLQKSLSGNNWRLSYKKSKMDRSKFDLSLSGDRIHLEKDIDIAIVPISLNENRSHQIANMNKHGILSWNGLSTAELTKFFSFHFTHKPSKVTLNMVLIMPIAKEFPPDREADIVRWCIKDKNSFYRYLLMLLGESSVEFQGDDLSNQSHGQFGDALGPMGDNTAILEEMVRIANREPERLHDINKLISKLKESKNHDEILSDKFLKLWDVFRELEGMTDD